MADIYTVDGQPCFSGGSHFTIWAPEVLFTMGAGWDSAKATCRALIADGGGRGRRK